MPIIGITTSFGEAHVELAELERVLVARGYSTLRSTMPIFTFGVEGVLGPVRVGLPVEGGWTATRHRERDHELPLRVLGGGLLVGYDFLRLPGSSTLVAARIHLGTLSVDAHAMRSAFGEQLARLDEGERVEGSFSAWSLEVGHERYFLLGRLNAVERAAIQFGIRIGYNWKLGGTQWSVADDRPLRGGPALDFSGARFRLVLGFFVD